MWLSIGRRVGAWRRHTRHDAALPARTATFTLLRRQSTNQRVEAEGDGRSVTQRRSYGRAQSEWAAVEREIPNDFRTQYDGSSALRMAGLQNHNAPKNHHTEKNELTTTHAKTHKNTHTHERKPKQKKTKRTKNKRGVSKKASNKGGPVDPSQTTA